MAESVIRVRSVRDEIYKKDRSFNLYCYLPDAGVNEKTGLMGIHTGYCLNPENVFFKKMRKAYAERFNVITFTAAYMGVEASLNRKLIFNSERSKITLQDIKTLTKPDRCIDLSHELFLDEKFEGLSDPQKTDYVDYGFCQSLDIANGLYYLIHNYSINTKRIYLLGSSLGSYLSHMVMKFLPKSVKGIIDISGLVGIEEERIINGRYCKAFLLNYFISMKTHSLYEEISQQQIDIRNLIMPEHFFPSQAKVVMLSGADDIMVPVDKKMQYSKVLSERGIDNLLKIIDDSSVDGKLVTHSGHSLGSNILGIFDSLFPQFEELFSQNDGMVEKSGDAYRYKVYGGYYETVMNEFIDIKYHES